MRVRITRLRRPHQARFLVSSALLGALAVGCGLSGEPLSLSLSVSKPICETERARIYGGSHSYRDEDGSWVEEETIYGWHGVSTVQVQWQARGGQEPYSLVIDSIPPYKGRPSAGSSGARKIGCADNSVGITHEYPLWGADGVLWLADPQVESGWKTIQAVATDANGDTAEATVDVYVVLVNPGSDRVLRGGETYRIYGQLFTVPDGIDMWCCEEGTEHPRDTLSFFIKGYSSASVVLDRVTFEEIERRIPPADAQSAEGVSLDAKLDEFVDSIGQLPDLHERVE